MKDNRITMAVAATLLTFAASAAMAAGKQALRVTASVSGICKFNSGQSPVLAFGTIDPSGTTSITATPANVLYRCTNGTSATVDTSVTGARSMVGETPLAATDLLGYSLSFTSGATGVGSGFGAAGSDITLVVAGSMTAAQYNDAKAGSYAETVTLTVTP